MANRLERPRFFENQYLGAADLEAVVGYSRDLSRDHALASHGWGIATGLELIEVPAEGGGGAVDLFLLPGIAWDGYGRAVLVLSPAPVPPEIFAGLASGSQEVWLRYDERPFRGLRAGFETCGVDEAFSRLRESFAIEAGPKRTLDQRQGGIVVAGLDIADARFAGRTFADAAPMDEAGSVPNQDYPEDTRHWLIPVGIANWVAGTPGSFQPRSPDAQKLSRTRRRMLGAITESVYAADGVIRLRDRFVQFKDGDDPEALAVAARLAVDDLVDQPDRDDPTRATGRLVSSELVWVEGNLRATGQVRLFGTRLELRDGNGAEAGDAPLYARRRTSPRNPAAGQDFQIVIGNKSNGADRLAVGPAAGFGDIEERLVLRSDGVLAAGRSIPPDLKTDNALFVSPGGITAALATDAGATSKLAFQTVPALSEGAHLAYDDTARTLRASVGSDLANATTFTPTGHVGIRAPDPISAHVDANDLVIHNPSANVGLTLLGTNTTTGNIHFADGLSGPSENRAGFIRYAHANNRLHLGTASATRATIDAAGDLGIGTEAPAVPLHIAKIRPNVRLDVADAGTSAGVEFAVGGTVQSAVTYDVATQCTRLSNGGATGLTLRGDRVGVNLGSEPPATQLHVRGAISGSAGQHRNHVALIDNTAGADADVLALRVGTVAAGGNNFITFFDSTGSIGRIEGNGAGGVAYWTSGADFAECLPRAIGSSAIGPGQIVGAKGGRLSLDTDGAESLLVTTDRAAVIGNAPRDRSDPVETVALVGQVRVRVDGPVRSGDFIVPSGRHDGEGRAIAPAALTPTLAGRVVGRAWEDRNAGDTAPVTIAVGMQGSDAMAALAAAVAAQDARITGLVAALAALSPGTGSGR